MKYNEISPKIISKIQDTIINDKTQSVAEQYRKRIFETACKEVKNEISEAYIKYWVKIFFNQANWNARRIKEYSAWFSRAVFNTARAIEFEISEFNSISIKFGIKCNQYEEKYKQNIAASICEAIERRTAINKNANIAYIYRICAKYAYEFITEQKHYINQISFNK